MKIFLQFQYRGNPSYAANIRANFLFCVKNIRENFFPCKVSGQTFSSVQVSGQILPILQISGQILPILQVSGQIRSLVQISEHSFFHVKYPSKRSFSANIPLLVQNYNISYKRAQNSSNFTLGRLLTWNLEWSSVKSPSTFNSFVQLYVVEVHAKATLNQTYISIGAGVR